MSVDHNHPVEQHTAQSRHDSRAAQTTHLTAELVRDATALETLERALQAYEIVLGALARRLSPAEAADMLSQVPSEVRERLLDLPAGPDRTIARDSIVSEVARELGLDRRRAYDVVEKIGSTISIMISPGQIRQIRNQLPLDIRQLLLEPLEPGP